MKKFIALTLTAVMTMSLLVGCGKKNDDNKGSGTPTNGAVTDDANKSSDDNEKITLKVAAFAGGNGEDIWKNLETAYEAKNKNVDIELTLSSELDKDLTKKFQNNDIPDVVYYNVGQQSGFTETMLKEKAIADITDVFDDTLKSKLIDGFLDNTITQPYGDGKIYLAPMFYSPTGLWYNKSLIGEGKKYALPTTWDEFFALGDQAKANGISLITFPQKGYYDSVLYSMLEQAGGAEFYAKALNYDKDTWTSESGQKVLDTLGKLAGKDYTHPDAVANANADGGFKINQQNVLDGKALFMPNGNWVIGEMAASTPADFEWGMMALPAFEAGGNRYNYTFFEQMWIPAEAKNIDTAKDFIKFMYSDEAIDILLANTTTNKETNEVSAAPVVQPVKGIADKLEGTTKEIYSVYDNANTYPTLGAFATTLPIEGLDFKKNVFGPIESIFNGDMTIDDWKTQLISTWEKCAANME